jgi:hypothetical protein
MTSGENAVPDDLPIHRIGGGAVGNLSLKPTEVTLIPPGISTLTGGTPGEAAQAMRDRFPRMAPRGRTTVGATTAGKIRHAVFDVIMNPTPNFPQHARLVHPEGLSGFSQENLERLSRYFQDFTGL